MKIKKQGFPSILPENDKWFIDFTVDAVKHSDPDASLMLHRFPDEIKVTIKPSDEGYKQHIIHNLLDVHKLFKVKIIFSKSLAISNHICYSIIW